MDYNDYVDPQAAAVVAPVIVGIAVLVNNMRYLVIRGLNEPIEVFKNQITTNEEATRIQKGVAPSQLDTAASHIATVVATEHHITAPVLRGVVCEVTS